MTPEPEPVTPWPPGPSNYDCAPGKARGHYCRADRTDGHIVWVCDYCGLRYRFGVGAVT